MKKKIWIFAALVLLIIILFAAPFRFTLTKDIIISRPIYDVVNQFTDLHNWQNWQPDFINKKDSTLYFSSNTTQVNSFIHTSNNHRFTLTATNPAGIVFKEENANKINYQSILAEPDSMGKSTHIFWKKYLTPLDWIKEKFINTNINTELISLKQSLEDPIKFYGFDIQLKNVQDTLFITKKIIIPVAGINKNAQQIFNELKSYIQIHQLAARDYGYISYKKLNSTQIQLAVGIPVSKRINNINDYSFLELPAQGRLLVGKYEGQYSHINNLYEAMQRYIHDNNLQRVADPLEKYQNTSSPLTDTSFIKTEVYFPVY